MKRSTQVTLILTAAAAMGAYGLAREASCRPRDPGALAGGAPPALGSGTPAAAGPGSPGLAAGDTATSRGGFGSTGQALACGG